MPQTEIDLSPGPSGTRPERFPVRIGRPQEFDCVRRFFADVGFNEDNVCRALAIEHMGQIGSVRWDEISLDEISAPLRWCVRVLVQGAPASEQDTRAICREKTFAALLSLGLLQRADRDPLAVVSPVWVYPAAGFVVISDRHDDPYGAPFTLPDDTVFPAIDSGTLRFLRLLPDTRNGAALDLCGGNGIGALHLSRTADIAVSADLTERSAFFADFNAKLNDAKVTSLCGDLYAPVAGRQFDLIACHPPFVPAVGERMIFRDSGETGEEITRRTVEGLPAHLRAGGTCVLVCMGRDTAEQKFEQRARDWLGAAGNAFDLIFGLEKIVPLDDMVASLRKRWPEDADVRARKLSERLSSLGTRQFVYGALVIRRYAESVSEPPARVNLTDAVSVVDFERLLTWRQHSRRAEFGDWLAQSRPRLAAQAELTIRHVVRESEFVAADSALSSAGGFQTALRLDPWIAPLIARFDGKSSVADVLEGARGAGMVPQGFTFDVFQKLVCLMVEREILDVDFPR